MVANVRDVGRSQPYIGNVINTMDGCERFGNHSQPQIGNYHIPYVWLRFTLRPSRMGSWPGPITVRGPQSAYMSRCQQVAPEGKTISRKGRESLFPCTTLLHCSLFLLLSPHVSPPPGEAGHGEISYCTHSDWCLTDPWRRQQNDVTSAAITCGSDFRRNHIGRNAITSRTRSQKPVATRNRFKTGCNRFSDCSCPSLTVWRPRPLPGCQRVISSQDHIRVP
jgi:hypothetical protein